MLVAICWPQGRLWLGMADGQQVSQPSQQDLAGSRNNQGKVAGRIAT